MMCAKSVPQCSNETLDDEAWINYVYNLEEDTDEDAPTGGEEEGNTSSNLPPTPKKINPAKYWCFTLNNYTDFEYQQLCARCSEMSNIDWAIIAKEIAPTTGTPHLQGAIAYKRKSRPSGMKVSPRIKWMKTVSNKQDQIRYCLKEDKDPYVKGLPMPTRIIKKETFFGWQRDLDKLVTEPVDDRNIYWIQGGYSTGKTTICKYLTNL